MSVLTTALAITGVVLIGGGVIALIHLARDYADDRDREAQYAREWAEIHRRNQEKR